MDRRTSIKTFILGAAGGTTLLSGAVSCTPETGNGEQSANEQTGDEGYGRTPREKTHDDRILAETFFTDHEMATLTALCGLILPADARSGSAVDAEVPDFIEFMAKDYPDFQLPLRGGLMWLDHQSLTRFERVFKDALSEQQTAILDDIAYPQVMEKDADHPMGPGIRFFNLVRNLTLTGFYTSPEGVLNDLEYKGNVANIWDGVPEEVMREHDLMLDPEWAAKCIDQSTRNELAQWDSAGNLI